MVNLDFRTVKVDSRVVKNDFLVVGYDSYTGGNDFLMVFYDFRLVKIALATNELFSHRAFWHRAPLDQSDIWICATLTPCAQHGRLQLGLGCSLAFTL
jgi:hypothetical protein